MQLRTPLAHAEIPTASVSLVDLIKKKLEALIEPLKCVYSNALMLCLSNQNCVTPLNYLENKIDTLFNRSQGKKKEKQDALRDLCNKFCLERNNIDKQGERISG